MAGVSSEAEGSGAGEGEGGKRRLKDRGREKKGREGVVGKRRSVGLWLVIVFRFSVLARGTVLCLFVLPFLPPLLSLFLYFSLSRSPGIAPLERSRVSAPVLSRAREGKYFISRLAWQEKGDTVRS